MKASIFLVAVSALILGGTALAQTAPAPTPGAPAAPRPAKTFKALTAEDVDPSKLLPPPVADDSVRFKLELAEVQNAYRNSTPERKAQAAWDDSHEDANIFAATLGPAFDLTKLPETAKLLKLLENDQSVAANVAKRYFLRLRPWYFDADMKPCDYKPGANPKTSYPSGHATLGYSVGYLLANLIPEKAQIIEARARDYAYSRLVCGDHFASDVEASHVLGVVTSVKLMEKPDVAPMIAAARKELKAAGLTAQ
ncbi:MAG: phosphatase PAP2 family protein [Pseudomonadota bacterium]|jgi:acid phosphatase (class A)